MMAITGLTLKRFEKLLPAFETALKKYNKAKHASGRPDILISPAEKLFYILFYLKCYPTFDLASLFFNVDRATTCRWTHKYIKVIEMTLKKKSVLPKRKIRSMFDLIYIVPEIKEILIDGTERPIRRPKNKDRQKENYSGKKKRHTVKNLLITDKKKKIHYVSKTYCGKTHDHSIFKEEKIGDHIPANIKTWLDNGFQGVDKDYPGLKIRMPTKKTRNRELSETQKNKNKIISQTRVLVEHSIGGIKRFGCLTNVYRNIKKDFEDKIFLVCAGLWNYHLTS